MPADFEKITEYQDREFPDLFRELPTLGSQLECPDCGADVFSDDINLDKELAKCHNCHHVFPFENKMNRQRRGRRRAEVIQPEGIEMFRLRSELNIDYKWRKTVSTNYFLLFFTLMWNAMILPAAFSAVLSGQITMLLGMSIHIAVGVGLLMQQISRLVNTTSITVDGYYLTIEHRPIKSPWKRDVKIPVNDIDQLYVTKRRKGSTNGIANYEYTIMLVDKNKRQYSLIKGLKNSDKALFIEQEIEYFLQIEDRPVRGEV